VPRPLSDELKLTITFLFSALQAMIAESSTIASRRAAPDKDWHCAIDDLLAWAPAAGLGSIIAEVDARTTLPAFANMHDLPQGRPGT
jgi:hypothetical protein